MMNDDFWDCDIIIEFFLMVERKTVRKVARKSIWCQASVDGEIGRSWRKLLLVTSLLSQEFRTPSNNQKSPSLSNVNYNTMLLTLNWWQRHCSTRSIVSQTCHQHKLRFHSHHQLHIMLTMHRNVSKLSSLQRSSI